MGKLKPRKRPCDSCPYRKDCPSGVWADEEYRKLIGYDRDTPNQPMGVFLCHSGDRSNEMCRGWLDVIDKRNSLALRFAMITGAVDASIVELEPSGVPVFGSGLEAHDHGVRDIETPGIRASKKIDSLSKRIGRKG